MSQVAPIHTLNDWIAEALPFALNAPHTLDTAIDTMIASLGEEVELLGFGEALHGGEELLILRNRLFERLVAAHGYRAIAIESSYPTATLVNDYVGSGGPASYEAVQEAGFSNGFGRLEANRELVAWMRRYNADPSHAVKLRFYGFDIPTGAFVVASPRRVFERIIAYLTSIPGVSSEKHRQRIEPLVGEDARWENPGVYTDPTQSYGRSPAASALRLATEDLISELRIRAPELSAGSKGAEYAEALHEAAMARQLLNYHAGQADGAAQAELLGIRDALMADNLVHIVARERERGKVLVFAHNAHLQRGKRAVWATWQQALGAEAFSWWPAGAHVGQLLGRRYAVIGSAVGVSSENGIGQPEANTLEARLTQASDSARFMPTRRGEGLDTVNLAALPTRSGSNRNLSYIPLSPQSFSDFDWLAVFNSVGCQRGGQPLPT